MTYIPSLVSFGVCSGSEKCDHFGRRNIANNNNKNPLNYNRVLAGFPARALIKTASSDERALAVHATPSAEEAVPL